MIMSDIDMELYFTKIAKNEFNDGFFSHQIYLCFKPFETVSDFLWTFGSIAVFPCYFFTLFWLVLIEFILLTGATFCALLMSNNDASNRLLSESSSAFQTSFCMLILSIFSAPFMFAIFLARMLAISGFIGFNFFETPRFSQPLALDLLASYARYIELMETINKERQIIIDNLKSFNEQVQHLMDEKGIDKKDAFFHSRNKLNTATNAPFFEEIIEVRHELDQLMNNYPRLNCGDSVEQIDMEGKFHILQLHHSKVVDIADILLKKINSMLNEDKSTNTYRI